MKKIILALLFFVTLFPMPAFAEGNSINSIQIQVTLDKNGTASILEYWDCNLTQGTEGYRTFTNLGQRAISDFEMTDDKRRAYQTLNSWNANATFEQKAGKCGTSKSGDKTELCWGITEYGKRTYTLQYKISNMVTQYSDYQGLDFNFLNLSTSVGNVHIGIFADFPITENNAKIWCFGYKGECVFEKDRVVLKADKLSKDEYMVALVKFEQNPFTVSVKSNESFSQIEEKEKQGSTYNGKDYSNILKYLLILLAIALISLLPKLSTFKKNFKHKKLPPMRDIEYFRDIPCEGDLSLAYWIAKNYKIGDKGKLKEGIIGATILRWIQKEQVKVIETKGGLFDWGKNKYALDFSETKFVDNTYFESELLSIIRSAAGSDKILEPKEFEKWCKYHYSKFEDLFTKLDDNSKLAEKGLLIRNKKWSFDETEELRTKALELKGLLKYLNDFSMIGEREAKEVVLWEDYLVFANLLGIAKKVESQFKKLYPDFNVESNMNNMFMGAYVAHHFSHVGVYSAAAARSAAQQAASGGFGGGSFSGGGGFSGGSSGGGFR